MPSDAEPSPLQLSGKRAKKVCSNTQLSDCPPMDSNIEDDDDEKNLSADKDNIVKKIRREMMIGKGIKKKLKRVRLSNDFINKKKKKKGKFEEESAFYNLNKDTKFNDEYDYDNYIDNGYEHDDEDDEYKEGDEFVLDMNEDEDNEENVIDGEDNNEDDFGILGVLEKNNKKLSQGEQH